MLVVCGLTGTSGDLLVMVDVTRNCIDASMVRSMLVMQAMIFLRFVGSCSCCANVFAMRFNSELESMSALPMRQFPAQSSTMTAAVGRRIAECCSAGASTGSNGDSELSSAVDVGKCATNALLLSAALLLLLVLSPLSSGDDPSEFVCLLERFGGNTIDVFDVDDALHVSDAWR
jgi:hypothetical protein